MEEDDEIHSQSQSPSPPSSPHQNGRLLSTLPSQPVTVAAAPPQHTLTLALPIQQPRQTGGGGGGGGGGREDCWSDGATSTLIDAWGERYLELSRGNLKQKHWQDVADIVSSREDYRKPPKTDVQCKNRIDTLKKKYKVEKGKIVSGQGPSQWIFFHRLDRLIGANTKITAGIANMANMAAAAAAAGGVTTPVVASKVPVAIPVGVRNYGTKPQQQWQQQHKMQQQQLLQEQQRKHPHTHPHPHPPPQPAAQFRRPGSMELESNSFGSEEEASPESSDSLPPDTQKRPRMERQMNSEPPKKGKESGWGNSIRELTRAILDFGESYERAETSKLQQVVEMEKQRMGFAKELELQRMHFFMKTQLELTQLKHGRRVGSSHHRHHHHNSNNRNNSD